MEAAAVVCKPKQFAASTCSGSVCHASSRSRSAWAACRQVIPKQLWSELLLNVSLAQPERNEKFSAASCQASKFSLSKDQKQICDPGLSGNDTRG